MFISRNNTTRILDLSEVKFGGSAIYNWVRNGYDFIDDIKYKEICDYWFKEFNERIFDTSEDNYEKYIGDFGYKVIDFIKSMNSELANNSWLYFKEFALCPSLNENEKGIPIIFNLGTGMLIQMYKYGFSGILYNPRQSFKSQTLAALYAYIDIFDLKNDVEYIGKSINDTKLFMSFVNMFKENLPQIFIKLNENSRYLKRNKIIIADEFEFLPNVKSIIDEYYNPVSQNIRILAGTTINRNLSNDMADYLDNLPNLPYQFDYDQNILYRIKYPVEDIFDWETIESQRRILGFLHDDDGNTAFDREVLLIRPR